MIAMALINSPDLLIADEPTTALDVTTQAQILAVIKKLQDEFGTALIMITHDLGVVAETADDIVVMYSAKVVEHAPVQDIFSRPRHPYTWGLMGSLPRLDVNVERLVQIPGQPPSLLQPAEGLQVQSRCTYTMSVCRENGAAPHGRAEHADACHLDAATKDREAAALSEALAGGAVLMTTVTGDELLVVEDLKKHFPITQGIIFQKEVATVKAVDGVSFTLRHGETLGIVGESGCGKSTLVRCILKLLEPTAGQDHLRGNRHHEAVAQRHATLPPQHDDGVPGSLRFTQRSQARRLHRR